jgi:hypothetical protein
MPEAHVLRDAPWNIFGTLTLPTDDMPRERALYLCKRWLAAVCKMQRDHLHMDRLSWVARVERGRKTKRAHVHVCIAAMPRVCVTEQFCRAAERIWKHLARSNAVVAMYDDARDGVGYMLKTSGRLQVQTDAGGSLDRADDEIPTLSPSLIRLLSRRSV